MTFLAEQKIVTGEDLKNLRVVEGVIKEVGNMLESAYVWSDLFQFEHEDAAF